MEEEQANDVDKQANAASNQNELWIMHLFDFYEPITITNMKCSFDCMIISNLPFQRFNKDRETKGYEKYRVH